MPTSTNWRSNADFSILSMVFSAIYYLELCKAKLLAIDILCYQQRLNRLYGQYTEQHKRLYMVKKYILGKSYSIA